MHKTLIATLVVAAALPLQMPGVAHAKTEAGTHRAAPSITLSVSDYTANEGVPITYKGRATGTYKDNKVTLQRKYGSGWGNLRTVTITPTYTYSITMKPLLSKHVFRAVGTLRNGTGRVVSPNVTVVTAAKPTPPPPTLEEARATILRDTNNYRASQGLSALIEMAELDQVAQDWTVHMASSGEFAHNPGYYEQYPSGWTGGGENIASGYAVAGVTKGWWDSPGHRANILGDYTHIGIGYAVDSNGRPYYTQNFATY